MGPHFRGKVVDEFDDGSFEVGSGSDGTLCNFRDALRAFRPHAADERVAAVVQESLEILEQRVFVLVEEALHFVVDLSCVVRNAEVFEADRLVGRVHLKQ